MCDDYLRRVERVTVKFVCAAALFCVVNLPTGGLEQVRADDTSEDRALPAGKASTSNVSSGPQRQTLDELNAPSSGLIVEESEQNIACKLLLYLPNRLFDLIDILRIDLGLGASLGGVVRVTRYGQFGYRAVNPVSFRVGIVGRDLGYFVERSTERGLGRNFLQSPERFVTPFELGAGLDAGVGVCAALSFDEFVDFLAGFFLYDIKSDDLGDLRP